jgi:hypothetical protein
VPPPLITVPTPPPVTRPTPPAEAPIAAPIAPPLPVPAPVIAAPAPAAVPVVAPAPAPAANPAPVVAPVAKPAPVIPPERREVAAAAPSSAIGAKLDARTVEQIFSCLATGLPSEWRKTWVVVTDSGAAVTGKFYYTVTLRNEDAEEFVPCNAQEVTRRIAGLGEGPGRWRAARLTIDSEGAYRLDYDR